MTVIVNPSEFLQSRGQPALRCAPHLLSLPVAEQ
jgi:hypothetical protein